MESFFRYISYVDYYKRGEKIRNVGFLRWKLYNNEHRIEIQLKDISAVQGSFEIKEKNTDKVIGKIKIDRGIGNFIRKIPSMEASGEMYIDTFHDRLYLSDVEGFLIQLGENEYLSVDVNLQIEKKADKFTPLFKEENEDNLIMAPEEKVDILADEKNQKESKVWIDEIEKGDHKKLDHESEVFIVREKGEDEKKISGEIEAASENILIDGIEEKYIKQDEQKQIEKYEDTSQKKKMKIIEPIHEDKWQQLCTKYSHVHPFPGKKVFLSIKPEDFIILQKEYQKLVHNSFLLHGFYNYGHMILGKLTDDEKAPVYVGVPGVYYEREKQAAQMFGFVGFESTEHPVQAGSYGYYMIEVEI